MTSSIARSKSEQFPIADIETIFRFRQPEPPLSSFVDSFWIYEGRSTGRRTERILPNGTLELVINLRQDELLFRDTERPGDLSRFSSAIISGAQGRGLVPDDPKEIFLIGVHFKPGGAFPFLGLPAGHLADTHADLENLWGRSATRLRDRICEAGSSDKQFDLLEEALVGRLRHDVEQHYAVSAALEMFRKHHAGLKVREAAKYIGLSERRFIQAFKTEVGLTPKLFSRILRFQRTRSVIQRQPSPDWAELAFDLGYFDQSHLIREFIEFSGLTPTGYLKRN
ncbi:MAG TPA: helix-turn-helix domain-containing protein [Pyrinomonadaceae bacterium]